MQQAGVAQPELWEVGEVWGASHLPAHDSLFSFSATLAAGATQALSGLPVQTPCLLGSAGPHSFSFTLVSPREGACHSGRISVAFLAAFPHSRGGGVQGVTWDRAVSSLLPRLRKQLAPGHWDEVEKQFLPQRWSLAVHLCSVSRAGVRNLVPASCARHSPRSEPAAEAWPPSGRRSVFSSSSVCLVNYLLVH